MPFFKRLKQNSIFECSDDVHVWYQMKAYMCANVKAKHTWKQNTQTYKNHVFLEPDVHLHWEQRIIITMKSLRKSDVWTALWLLEQLFEWPTLWFLQGTFNPAYFVLINSVIGKRARQFRFGGNNIYRPLKGIWLLTSWPFNSKTWSIWPW